MGAERAIAGGKEVARPEKGKRERRQKKSSQKGYTFLGKGCTGETEGEDTGLQSEKSDRQSSTSLYWPG